MWTTLRRRVSIQKAARRTAPRLAPPLAAAGWTCSCISPCDLWERPCVWTFYRTVDRGSWPRCRTRTAGAAPAWPGEGRTGRTGSTSTWPRWSCRRTIGSGCSSLSGWCPPGCGESGWSQGTGRLGRIHLEVNLTHMSVVSNLNIL